MPYLLNQEQIDFYRNRHYLHARQVVPQDVLEMGKKIVQAWVDETIDDWFERGLIRDKATDLDLHHRLVKAWIDAGKPKYVRSPRRDLVGPDMYEFLKHPRLLDLAADLLGTEDISVHGIFNSRPKLPDQKWTDTPWHQDAQYYRDAENVHVLSVWIPLQKVTEQNSCLQVAPGLFANRLLDGEIDEETNFLGIKKEDSRQLEGISIEMEPGDALCFTQLLPHRALPNRSNAVRWSLDIRYEATATATKSGKVQGFTARSITNPDTVETCEQWLEKWSHIPRGSY